MRTFDDFVGGSMGLCHSTNAAVDQAADWYSENREACERPIVPALRCRFGLTAAENVQAIKRVVDRSTSE